MKLLLLLTAAFPYDSGEEFLSAELDYAQGFDQILVCPCNLKPESLQTKPLPQNVSCRPLFGKKLSRADYPRVMAQLSVYSEAVSLLHNGKLTKQRFRQMLFFMRKARSIFLALRALPELDAADDVTIYSYWFYDAAAAGALLADELKKKGIRVRLVSRAHGFDVHSERAENGYLPMRRFLLSHVDGLYPCSLNGTKTIASEFPEYAGKIRTKYLGTRDRGEKLGSRRGFHLVSCSYMVPVKRLHLIPEALALADFPVRWTHIGSGPMENELRTKAERVPSCVQAEFLGQMKNDAILDYYKENDIAAFVNVSASEGIPVSIMEACSIGLPVLATDVGGTSEIVSDGENGCLLPADFSPERLLEAFRSLNNMAEVDYSRMCVRSREIWAEKFDAARNYRGFYKELGS